MSFNQKKQTVHSQFNIAVYKNERKINKTISNIKIKSEFGILSSTGNIEFSIDENSHLIIYKHNEPNDVKLYVNGELLFQRDSLIPIGGGTFDFKIDDVDCEFYHMGVVAGVMVKISIGGECVYSNYR